MTHSTAVFPFDEPKKASDAGVLLVDDERAILDGLRRQLRRSFAVSTANSGSEALELMESESFGVVISDMRMPEMDGATFLSLVRRRHPNTVRMLLTGQADTQSAIAAINEGQIFRFLTKPCQPDTLQSALRDAIEQNRLITAEKELLEKTLRSTVQTLTATLSLAHPQAFSRAVRITRVASELAAELDADQPWLIEITAMLAHLGAVSLPPKVLAKLEAGLPLSEDERDMTERVPAESARLIAHVPRLDRVAAAISLHRARYDGAGADPTTPSGDELPLASRILRVALDFDAFMSPRPASQAAIAKLDGDPGAYDPDVLAALRRCYAVGGVDAEPVKIEVAQLRPGMVLAEDVLTDRGLVLVGRGTAVTEPLLHRLENFGRLEGITSPVLVEGQRT
jgi:response regulator RpfG family c-di-GMP phosphodiesterase